jgi:cell wall assembly regulator SMI1
MSLSSSLEQIEKWLREERGDYFEALQPGATAAALEAFEARFKMKLPAGFRALYQWRNGQGPDEFASLVQNRMFLSLESAAEAKEALDGMIEIEFDDRGENWWRREWVPFLDNGGGDYLVVDLTEGHGGRLIDYWHDEERRKSPYPSVDAWLQELASSMEDGSYEFC